MKLNWSPFQKHNHNTTENREVEKALLKYFGAELTDGKPGQPDGIVMLPTGLPVEIEICCPKPGTSPNIKNRIDEKMGRIYRQSLDDADTAVLVLFAAPTKRDMETAIRYSRESANMMWMFAYYECEEYVFFWSDGTPVNINEWKEKCKFH